MVEDTTKLYFYDVRNGRVRGTERVKLVGDSEFTVLKQQPADVRPVTVYYYARRDGEEDPDSQSRGVLQECFRYQIRQRPLRQSDKTTDTQSVRKGCAIAARVPAWWNLDLMNPYRDPHGSSPPRHVHKTYRICSATTSSLAIFCLNEKDVECLLCGKSEGELRFEACHAIPYNCSKNVFREYGLINGKIDGLNGVFFCHECHQYYDNGHWKRLKILLSTQMLRLLSRPRDRSSGIRVGVVCMARLCSSARDLITPQNECGRLVTN